MNRDLHILCAHLDDFEISCNGYVFKHYDRYELGSRMPESSSFRKFTACSLKFGSLIFCNAKLNLTIQMFRLN